MRSWSSLISVVTGLCTGQSGFSITAGGGVFLLSRMSRPALGPNSLLFNGCQGSWWRREEQ